MFAKYMKELKKPENLERLCLYRLDQVRERQGREVAKLAEHQASQRALMEARHAREVQFAHAPEVPPVEAPSALLLRVAAYVADCADCGRAPSHQDALRRRYATTGAALHYALADALRLAWVGQSSDGALYWRDAGSESSCPLRGWAALGEELRGK